MILPPKACAVQDVFIELFNFNVINNGRYVSEGTTAGCLFSIENCTFLLLLLLLILV